MAPPQPMETSASKANIANPAQHLGNQPHRGRRSSSGGPGLLRRLPSPRPRATGHSQAVGPAFRETSRPAPRGYLCTPRSPHRTGAKGALGSRPVASAECEEDCGGSGDCWRGVRYTVGKNVPSLGERSGTPGEPESAAR